MVSEAERSTKISAEPRYRRIAPGNIQLGAERDIPKLPGMICWLDAPWLGYSNGSQWFDWEPRFGIIKPRWTNLNAGKGIYYTSRLGGQAAFYFNNIPALLGGPMGTYQPFHIYLVAQKLSSGGDTWQRIISAHDGRTANDYTLPSWSIISPNGEPNTSWTRRIFETTGTTTKTMLYVWLGSSQVRNNRLTGDIAEVLIYDRVLEAKEQTDVEAYLTAKYDL
jgi:hypothetical protein